MQNKHFVKSILQKLKLYVFCKVNFTKVKKYKNKLKKITYIKTCDFFYIYTFNSSDISTLGSFFISALHTLFNIGLTIVPKTSNIQKTPNNLYI